MAGTTPVTLIEHTHTRNQGFHLPTLIDELVLHHQLPTAKLYFHKEENERCTRQRESQSEYYYMIKGQNCSDMSPHVTALVFETPLVLFNFIRSSLSAFSSTFTNHTP